jgi:DNA gyrase subunit B
MPEIVDKGYLYIAQPPLYRAKRGRSEVYLKDDRALEDYLIDAAIEDAVLTLFDGTRRAGEDLRTLVDHARRAKALLAPLGRRVGNAAVVEQAAIAAALNTALVEDPARAGEAAAYMARRLDALFPEHERGWTGMVDPDRGLIFSRTLRGVAERYVIDRTVMGSPEAGRLDAMAGELQAVYTGHAKLKSKEQEVTITSPTGLFDAILEQGRKGLAIQRYKGLGEMNPEQLWQTTLDPAARTLLQVRVNHADEAEEVFSTLMGDVVEPRREFIQANALKVVNLDV